MGNISVWVISFVGNISVWGISVVGTVDTPLLGRGRAGPGRVPPFHLQEAARPWDLLPLTFR